MAFLTRDQIVEQDDRTYDTVFVPAWKGDVRLRSLTGTERDRFEAGLQERKGGKVKDNMANFRARLVSLCLVDEKGVRLFTSTAEIILLGNKSAASLQLLFDKCNEMNGFSDSDIEELAEDFEEAPSEPSTSA